VYILCSLWWWPNLLTGSFGKEAQIGFFFRWHKLGCWLTHFTISIRILSAIFNCLVMKVHGEIRSVFCQVSAFLSKLNTVITLTYKLQSNTLLRWESLHTDSLLLPARTCLHCNSHWNTALPVLEFETALFRNYNCWLDISGAHVRF